MSEPILPREEVARHLGVAPHLLERYERRGLVRVVSRGTVEGYGPVEVRRLWTILSCQRDLGINLAGVEAILKLNDHLDRLHRQLDALTAELLEVLEHRGEPGGGDG